GAAAAHAGGGATAREGGLSLSPPGGPSGGGREGPASVGRAPAAVRPEADAPMASPGMAPSHYAPRTPLALAPGPRELPQGARRIGLVGVFSTRSAAQAAADAAAKRYGVPVELRALTDSGDLEEAARNLFTMLREL